MKILVQLEEYADALLELIYPSDINCIACSSSLRGGGSYGLCPICLERISFIKEHSCWKCAKPLAMSHDGDVCQDCKDAAYSFHRALAVVEYKGIIKQLVFKLKYHDATYLARTMASMMVDCLKREEIKVDLILPVPLYPQKERQRGFNQAHLLGKYISKNTNIPYCKNNLIRTRNTGVMHNLSKGQRQKNVKEAFAIKNSGLISCKDILLIDDIFTSGSTVDACSRVLMEAEAKSVTVLTFSRGV